MVTIAVFIALGGSSYAAIKVTGKDVKSSSLTGKDVKNRSLLAVDFKAGQLPAGSQRPQGAKGDPGTKGDRGANGAPGTARAYAVVDPGAPPAAGISPSDRPAVVSVDWDSTTPPEGNGVAMRVLSFCPADTFGVLTERRVGSGDASNADNIGFSIIVP